MKKIITLATLFLTGTAMAQQAGTSETGIRYNEVSVAYNSASAVGETLQGYTVMGSALLDQNYTVDVAYTDVSTTGSSISSTAFNVGYRMGIASNVDLGVKLGYIDQGGDNPQSSYVVGVGIGAVVAPNVVLSGTASYTGLSSTEYLYGAAIAYYLTENTTIRGSVRASSGTFDTTTYSLGVGYNF